MYMVSTLSENTHIHQVATLADTYHENTASRQQPKNANRTDTATSNTSNKPPCKRNPTVTAEATEDFTKRCTCAAKSSSALQHSTHFYAMSHESDTSAFHLKPLPKASPNSAALSITFKGLRTVAGMKAKSCEHSSTSHDPQSWSREHQTRLMQLTD